MLRVSSGAVIVRRIRILSVALVVLLAVPVAARAQPPNDGAGNAFALNNQGTALTQTTLQGETNVDATTDGSEPLTCKGISYDHTVWYIFFPHTTGRVDLLIADAQFAPVAGIYPYDQQHAIYDVFVDGVCSPPVSDSSTVASIDVSPSNAYLVQVGSANTFQGLFTLFLDFKPNVDLDRDRDGVDRPADCNDGDPAIAPGRPEVVNNSVDENCDGVVEFDRDGDGYRSPGRDCNDQSAAVHPGAREIPLNGLDDNCDGDPGAVASIAQVTPEATMAFTFKSKTRRKFLTVTSLVVRNVPDGASVEVTCERKGKPACRRKTQSRAMRGPSAHAARTFEFKAFQKKLLRIGTMLELRVTKPLTVGKYIGYRIVSGGFRKTEGCLNPGSRKPLKKCVSAAF